MSLCSSLLLGAVCRLDLQAMNDEWGTHRGLWRGAGRERRVSGGSILRHVWIPCVLTGFANPGANLHAPDENIHLDKYLLGIKYAAAIMEHFSKR